MIFHGVETTHYPGYLYAVHFPEQELWQQLQCDSATIVHGWRVISIVHKPCSQANVTNKL